MKTNETIYLSPSRTIEAIGGYGVYNYEGTHFRVFASTEDAKRFCDGDDNVAVLFDTWYEKELDEWIEKNNKPMNKKKLIIEVSGGMVVGVYTDLDVEVKVLDHDNFDGCEEGENQRVELEKEISELSNIF
jgi:hypothetical protein